MKVTVIIERGTDGNYSAYMDANNLSFGLIGDGKSVKETMDDFYNSYEEMKLYYHDTGKDFPELMFVFKNLPAMRASVSPYPLLFLRCIKHCSERFVCFSIEC
jgi:hypothetical protein